jgi:1,4-alpha-glucan branching enzyme
MGQEFLEDKYWSDNPAYFDSTLIWWDGLSDDRAMQDFHRFMRELVGVRRRFRALRSDSIDVFHVHNDNRVITFHRWIEGVGEDVVVVVSLSEHTWYSYELGFPANGSWREVLIATFMTTG